MIIYPIITIIAAYIAIEQRQTIRRLRNTNKRLKDGLDLHEKIYRDYIVPKEKFREGITYERP
jgi:hypothetical protein